MMKRSHRPARSARPRPGPRPAPRAPNRPRRDAPERAARLVEEEAGPRLGRGERRAASDQASNERRGAPSGSGREALHVASLEVLARTAAAIARDAERAVLGEGKR